MTRIGKGWTMMRQRGVKRGAAMLTAGLAATLAGCGGPDRVTVDDAWIRLPAVPGRPGAAYFTLEGGPTNATLIGVSADIAIRAEMHESMAGPGGMASMKPLASVAVPAKTDTVFAPDGRHVMLFDINPKAKAGRIYNLTLNFANGARIYAGAMAVGAADPKPDF
ncbi:copper chaperone PCu(A)C [Sphingomonas sp. RP10(2022)]|uniref:Copper chaperone PCu(A)C n=1 Tax=Sphingomonas liriopis TaxID=2949094 RepID=A0A9X2KQ50_9SPHN|nr:copper chaperone PCu(A)C [Sphingomonas liriopis]MCP3734231.1 copper chaperone PCu(A)C [Sphingomonas liriopis]